MHEYLAWIGSILILVHAGIHFNALLPWLAILMLLIAVATGLIGKFLLQKSNESLKLKKQKSELERDSGSQARIMADLHQDIEESQVKLDVLLNSKVALTAEQATIQWDTKKESGKLRSIENSIITQQEKLEKLQFKVKEAVFTLEETINKDITTRAALAEKEIKLREEKINLKNKEEAIKKELLANEQLRPDKWDNLKRFDDIKEHLRL